MITAEFIVSDGLYTGFSIKGHSGYASEGEDIVCSAVSAMAMLASNTITDIFGIEADCVVGREAEISFSVRTAERISSGIINGLFREMSELSKEYGSNVKAAIKHK